MNFPFVYEGQPYRVLFGHGMLGELPDEAERLGCGRLLVLSTPDQRAAAEEVAALLGDRCAATYHDARMHTPVEVTEDAMVVVAKHRIDGLVALGGGSAIGLSKAIALRTDLPQIAVPTTYAGSEMTRIIGQTEAGEKTTQVTAKVLPETVIYDVDLTLTLPPKLSITSGINAMAHAVEALYATNGNPIVQLMAEQGIAALYRGLPTIAQCPDDKDARRDALYGAWLCAICLGQTSMALHHKLCHVLGGSFDLPHAETHTIILPHALAYNAPAARDAVGAIKRALGGDGIAGRIYDLAEGAGVPVALRDLGMEESDIDRTVALVLATAYANPRPLEPKLLRRLIANAWAGVRPDHSTYAD
ncbi:TfdF [Sphingobium herbicidovorans NBRC 16415]|uniref:TfdF n=1 Tax=Sphingobium herbicidovorans (strain ATCC 700291 / DSM 11019 / CCUG 56400 / KCTC 2939 / LMG 18315 / NBRC 16415 / MH) TaxID=1219045 RepID=A0A086P5Y1_SPHHM|nr:maleylacetate reductase [Sphingobium herbicidovorans]KFG88799.1 TfdF [Sphingobium herbicidovorans NBRC 16415]